VWLNGRVGVKQARFAISAKYLGCAIQELHERDLVMLAFNDDKRPRADLP
jgi:hypothetical protein